MIAKLFWLVVILDGIAAVVLWGLFKSGTHGLAVAAYLLVVAAIVVITVLFPLFRSEGWRVAALSLLLLPSAPLVYFAAAAAANTVRTERQFSGSAYFQGAALALAQAMARRDAGLVKQLVSSAGDLNQPQGGGTTLWQFGVVQADNTEESIDMLRTLLAAGADPRRDDASDTLAHAIATGPRLTQFLLEAGANPNVLDHDRRPVWWQTMGQGEDDASTALFRMMLEHGADLRLRSPDGRGPVGQAVAQRYWYDACLLIERGADWRQEKTGEATVAELLEWEILRRYEYPLSVPDKLRLTLAEMRGEPVAMATVRVQGTGRPRIPDLLREASVDRLGETREAVARLAQQQPDWVRRVTAFFGDGDSAQRGRVALLLSLKPEALPEEVQERCWTVVREQVEWYERSARAVPGEPKGWLLKEAAVIAAGVASIPGPVREGHRADFVRLRDRIEERRKANDPAAADLVDLRKADWMSSYTGLP